MSLRDDLRRRLRAHTPIDATEAEHQRRMLELVEVETPFSRKHFVPGHFTASAFVLSPDETKLLLILHGKLGLWLQPGGHIDGDDADVVAAGCREVAEETGLTDVELVGDGLLDLDIHPIPPNPKKDEPAHEHFDVRVLLRSRTWDFAAGSDAVDARWVPVDEVVDAGTDDSVLRAVRRVQAR